MTVSAQEEEKREPFSIERFLNEGVGYGNLGKLVQTIEAETVVGGREIVKRQLRRRLGEHETWLASFVSRESVSNLMKRNRGEIYFPDFPSITESLPPDFDNTFLSLLVNDLESFRQLHPTPPGHAEYSLVTNMFFGGFDPDELTSFIGDSLTKGGVPVDKELSMVKMGDSSLVLVTPVTDMGILFVKRSANKASQGVNTAFIFNASPGPVVQANSIIDRWHALKDRLTPNPQQ